MTEDLARSLAAAFPDCTPADIADVLWLVAALPAGPDGARTAADRTSDPAGASAGAASGSAGTPEVPPADTPAVMLAPGPPTGSRPGQAVPARLVGMRAPAAISQPASLARSLSPFKRVRRPGAPTVDIDATVEATADARRLVVVTAAASDRGLDVALVADTSPVMAAFEQVLAEFAGLLGRTGAFRSVSRWFLVHGPEPRLRDRSGTEHPADRLSDPSGRRLVLLATDAVADHWHEDPTWHVLRRWAAIMPTAVLYVLPARYLTQGLLGASAVSMRPAPGAAPNSAAEVARAWWDDEPPPVGGSVPVPVIPLQPETLADWATALAAGSTWVNAVWARRPPGPPPREANAALTARTRVSAFQARASRGSQSLARILADAPVLTVALMRVLQGRLVPGTGTSELAEVLVSGLLEREVPGQHDTGRYRLRPGVSELLRQGRTAAEEWDVYQAVTSYLTENAGTGSDIRALLADPAGTLQIPDLEPFAALGRTAMTRLGMTPVGNPQTAPGLLSVHELRSRVDAAMDRAAAALPAGDAGDQLRDDLQRTRARLSESLQAVLVGRVACGKTTLANALVGAGSLISDIGRHANVIKVIRSGQPPSLTVRYRDGRAARYEAATQAAIGALNEEAAGSIAALEIALPSPMLTRLTLIDTPGLAFPDDTGAPPAQEYLDLSSTGGYPLLTRDGASQADVLIAVATIRGQLSDLRRLIPGLLAPGAAVGALTKADQLWHPDQPDPMAAARRTADRLMQEGARRLVSQLQPVAADVALAAQTLTEQDLQIITGIARLRPSSLAERAAAGLPALENDGEFPNLADLYLRLGGFGLVLSAGLIRDGLEPTRLRGEVEERTGITGLRRILTQDFGGRAELLKLNAVLEHLRSRTLLSDPRLSTDLDALRAAIGMAASPPDTASAQSTGHHAEGDQAAGTPPTSTTGSGPDRARLDRAGALELQQRLANLGFLAPELVSGTFDTETRDALATFQRQFGIYADGQPGSVTGKVLRFLEAIDYQPDPVPISDDLLVLIRRVTRSQTLGIALIGVVPATQEPEAQDTGGTTAPAQAVARELVALLNEHPILQGAEFPDGYTVNRLTQLADSIHAELIIYLQVLEEPAERAGAATYFFSTGSADSAIGEPLARCVHDELTRIPGVPDRGCRGENSSLLRQPAAAAIRVELGNLSQGGDRARLQDPEQTRQLAAAVMTGISRLYNLDLPRRNDT